MTHATYEQPLKNNLALTVRTVYRNNNPNFKCQMEIQVGGNFNAEELFYENLEFHDVQRALRFC